MHGLAVPGLHLCVCFVGYLGKKNPMYQQETTIRQRVNVIFFTYQVAVNLTFYLSSFGEKIRKNCKNLVAHDLRFGD